jgi:hypothetical protein
MAKWVYAKYVKGIQPRMYMHKAADASRPAVLAEFQAGGTRIAKRLEDWGKV